MNAQTIYAKSKGILSVPVVLVDNLYLGITQFN